MSVYGEMGDEFRPRPAWWRIAAVSISQFLIAVAITNLLLAVVDAVLLLRNGIEKALVVHIGTWRSAAPLPGYDAEHAVIAVVMLIVAEIVLDFLPMPRSLAMRHFAIAFAESFAVFGSVTLALRQPLPAEVVILAAAALFVWRAELAAVRAFANVMDMKRPLRRIVVWLLRIGIWSAAATLPLSPFRWQAIGLAVITLLVNLGRKPGETYEETREPEMREAAAVLPLVAALLVAALVWLTPRVIVITTHGVSIRPQKSIGLDLPKRLRDRQPRR